MIFILTGNVISQARSGRLQPPRHEFVFQNTALPKIPLHGTKALVLDGEEGMFGDGLA